jgi:glyoxylase-like metal-dependent hydrolase (beta-lactamase superfamily II)
LTGEKTVNLMGAVNPGIDAPSGPLALMVDGSGAFALPAASASSYEKHLQIATANAGAGPFGAPASPGSAAAYEPASLRKQWCYTAENAGTPAELGDRNQVAPTQMFDDVWAFGLRTVLQYGFKGPDGRVFLIDTLNNATEAATITLPGLAAMGGSGAQLIGAMPTHGHADHFGGGAYLQQNFGIPVYLGSADAAGRPFTVTSTPSNDLAPQDWTFGHLRTTLLSTPGHTPGTFSGVLPVTLAGKSYSVAFWGGTAMPGTTAAARQYLDGAERLYRLSDAKKVDGTIHTHPFVDGSLAKLDALRANPSLRTTANPFLIGNGLALRSLAILRECSAAKVAQLDTTAIMDAWHVTTVELDLGDRNPNAAMRMAATVRTPFGVLRNAQVKFTVAPSGESCVAYSDARGEASCKFNQSKASQSSSVTAEFVSGSLGDGSVQLGSSVTIALK